METVKRVVRKLMPRPIETPPSPVAAEKSAYSAVFSVFDDEGRPSQRLTELAIDAVERAMHDVSLEDVGESKWPGQEYRLLGGLMLALAPRLVVQIGTEIGMSELVLRKYLPADSQLVIFASDLIGPQFVEQHRQTLQSAQFILVHGPANGEFEQRLLEQLSNLRFPKPPLVMFNDTRLWPMLRFYRMIKHPKLDLTSFGRWSGTLLVELPNEHP